MTWNTSSLTGGRRGGRLSAGGCRWPDELLRIVTSRLAVEWRHTSIPGQPLAYDVHRLLPPQQLRERDFRPGAIPRVSLRLLSVVFQRRDTAGNQGARCSNTRSRRRPVPPSVSLRDAAVSRLSPIPAAGPGIAGGMYSGEPVSTARPSVTPAELRGEDSARSIRTGRQDAIRGAVRRTFPSSSVSLSIASRRGAGRNSSRPSGSPKRRIIAQARIIQVG